MALTLPQIQKRYRSTRLPRNKERRKATHEIMELFGRLNEEKHQTIIMVTHNPELGAQADRIIHFRDGRVIEE